MDTHVEKIVRSGHACHIQQDRQDPSYWDVVLDTGEEGGVWMVCARSLDEARSEASRLLALHLAEVRKLGRLS